MFNADLALSVTMAAISTLLSIVMLPANLLLYSRVSYNDDVIAALDWMSLFVALAVVIGAITLGLFCSAKIHSHKFNVIANKVRYKEWMRASRNGCIVCCLVILLY
jgi:Sodium Bile acid symporter family.